MLRQATTHSCQQSGQGLKAGVHHAQSHCPVRITLVPRHFLPAKAFSTTPSSWQPQQGRSRRGKGPTLARKTKATPDWKIRERELGEQIRSLEQRIVRLDKKKDAQAAAENLPELDEALLDQIYAGVKEEPPLSHKENRLLLSEEQKRLERYAPAIESRNTTSPALEQSSPPDAAALASVSESNLSLPGPSSFAQRMERRLHALTQQLLHLRRQSQTEGQPSSSTTQRDIEELHQQVDILQDMLATVKVEETSPSTNEVGTDNGGLSEQMDIDLKGESTLHSGGSEGESQYTQFSALEFPVNEQMSSPTSKSAPSLDEGAEPIGTTAGAEQRRAYQIQNEIGLDHAATSTARRDLDQLVELIEAASESQTDRAMTLGSILSEEWTALGFASASQDTDGLLQRTSMMLLALPLNEVVPVDCVVAFHNAAADAFASRGDVDNTKALIGLLLENGFPVDSYAQHALVKSHLKQDPANPVGGIAAALSILNNLEEAGEPASQATYSLVLSALLDAPDMATKDEAWGLWYRMRLNAHPTPDAVVWSNMLRACALGSTPARNTGLALQEAHRGAAWLRPKQTVSELRGKRTHRGEAETALDLFKEMTLVEGIKPNPACYDHLILACCRGHDSASYLEGFRLLSEMISTAEEMQLSAFEPTRTTYNALLEGCKLNKDLLRARWVLAEMIRSSAALWSQTGRQEATHLSWQQRARLVSRMPDAETLGKLFFTYAAWRPPKRRMVSKESQSGEQINDSAQQEGSQSLSTPRESMPTRTRSSAVAAPQDSSRSLSQPEMDEAATSFSSTPPSTSAEAVREVRGLLARVILDRMTSSDDQVRGPMSCVVPSARLLNAYLSVLKVHQPARQILETFSSAVEDPEKSLFAKMGLVPNAHTYLLVLETCSAHARQQPAATRLADWAWARWRKLEERALTGRLDQQDDSVSRGTIAEIWSARISFLARVKPLDEAVSALREFLALYPPTPKHDRQTSGITRKMPYFDFRSIKADIELKEAQNRQRMMVLIQKLQHSWKQMGQDVRLLSNESSPSLSIEGDSSGHEPVSEANLQREEQDTAGPAAQALDAESSASAAKIFRSIFQPRPPSLTFFDLNLLHQRLKTTSTATRPTRDAELKMISWACKVWESQERPHGAALAGGESK